MANQNDFSSGCMGALAVMCVLGLMLYVVIQGSVNSILAIWDWAAPWKILAGFGAIVFGLVLSLWSLKTTDALSLLWAVALLVVGAVALVWGAIQLCH